MSFYEDTIKRSAWFEYTGRCCEMALLEPVLRGIVQDILVRARGLGHELRVWETYRSQARQSALFEKGATQLQTVGVHHYGLACDLIVMLNGDPTWKADYGFLGELAHDEGLVWGGDWVRFSDRVHVQRVRVADQKQLFAGEWYPDDDYRAYP